MRARNQITLERGDLFASPPLIYAGDKGVFPTAPIAVIIAVCGRAPFVEPRQTQVASNSA